MKQTAERIFIEDHLFINEGGVFKYYKVRASDGGIHDVTIKFDEEGNYFDVSCVDGIDGSGLLSMPIVSELHKYFSPWFELG